MRLTWLGHSSVKLETGSHLIYIDPYAGRDDWYQPATEILVSRFHFDHCSIEKVRKCSVDSTKTFGASDVAKEIFPCTALNVGESVKFEGVEVVAMPVSNPHVDFIRHVETENALGFVIVAENKTVYFMADSDLLKQCVGMKPDVLLIAVGGTYTAAAREAAEIAKSIDPKLAIPIHWGSLVGTRDDADLFDELAGVPVKVLNPGSSVEI